MQRSNKGTTFQFHYGTIKSPIDVETSEQVMEFQFHYGTIKSGDYKVSTSKLYYFNSTMVRLKGSNESNFRSYI